MPSRDSWPPSTRQQRSLPLTVLADRAGLPVPTTYRLVTELVRHGLLERDESKQIRIGLRLWELSTRGSEALSLRDTPFPTWRTSSRAWAS